MPDRNSPRRPARNLLGYHRKKQPQFRIPSKNAKPGSHSKVVPGNLNLLTRESRECLQNLASYHAPKPTSWLPIPRSRRAAVLVALFVGRKGDLYVLLSRRASTLRSFAGDTSLPGGKMDPEDRTIEDTARREAFEEIGLPVDKKKAPLLCIFEPFWVEKQLVVTPVVVLILDTSLRPILNHSEVASLFSHPLASFLSSTPPFPKEPELEEVLYHTYQDYDWHGPPLPMKTQSSHGLKAKGESTDVIRFSRKRNRRRSADYLVPSSDPVDDQDASSLPKTRKRKLRMHRFLTGREAGGIKPVYGLTAAILIHVAQVGYKREPDFEVEPPPFDSGPRSEEESLVPTTDMRIAWALLNRPSPIYDALVEEGLEGKVDWGRVRELLGLDMSHQSSKESRPGGRRSQKTLKAKL
ncbi:hypothetical protein K435DRAFT_722017 [Dendrothele bispora CBS 962.96]|uniref:Nudix hydrolase domain-containing protein n=1 Tax=Dendrothele bispora (strain CBS 962.96) TaxID=1314807 RepID=A0A4S8M4X4_DENBC|nr:hypothetical protein K435DRAFT_722017 [Dendrothele bispora CBS 962.96]